MNNKKPLFSKDLNSLTFSFQNLIINLEGYNPMYANSNL